MVEFSPITLVLVWHQQSVPITGMTKMLQLYANKQEWETMAEQHTLLVITHMKGACFTYSVQEQKIRLQNVSMKPVIVQACVNSPRMLELSVLVMVCRLLLSELSSDCVNFICALYRSDEEGLSKW